MKTYHIYLFRHGETEANELGYYAGRIEVPLSDAGRAQLRAFKKKYYYPQGDMYFISPKKRCLQTLEILYPGVNAEVVDDINECDFGDYEGKRFNELKDDPEYQKWASGARDCPPNGESSKEFEVRTCKGFEAIVDKLLRSGKKSAVIVAHGGTVMTILGTYGFPRRPMYEWMTDCGAGYELLITPQLWMSGKAVEVAGSLPLQPGESENVEPQDFTYFNAAISDIDNDNSENVYDDEDVNDQNDG